MGYRSDLLIQFSSEVELPDDVIKYFCEEICIGEEGECTIEIHSVKWRDDFDDVKAIEDFISTLDDDHFKFLRIGDEIDDIEQRGFYGESNVAVTICTESECARSDEVTEEALKNIEMKRKMNVKLSPEDLHIYITHLSDEEKRKRQEKLQEMKNDLAR